jgi:N-acetylneuraminic acid mutarotase
VYLLGNRTKGDVPLLRYDLKGDAWKQVSASSVTTDRTAAVELNGYIYVICGEDPKGGELSRVSRYEVATGKWVSSP